jgi:hypothetical protein
MSVAYRGGDMRASKLALAAVCLLSTACLSHADDQPTVNTIDAQLSEIGDVTIIRDTDTLVLEGQKVIETVQKSSAKDRSEDFRLIRPIRAKLSKRSPELRALLEAFRQYKFSLKNQIQQKQAAIESKKTDTDTIALLDLQIEKQAKETAAAKSQLEEIKQELSRPDLTDDARKALERKISQFEFQVREGTATQSFIEKNKARIQQAASVDQKEIDNYTNLVSRIDKILSEGQGALRRSDELLVNLDDISGSLLQTDVLNINYTDRTTYIFGALVGSVILGFFIIAFLSDKVREAIFSGDSGIQFVTLFSLVIAIILFGVLKILEGKELAALLGVFPAIF